jgi:hypothetical protein
MPGPDVVEFRGVPLEEREDRGGDRFGAAGLRIPPQP